LVGRLGVELQGIESSNLTRSEINPAGVPHKIHSDRHDIVTEDLLTF